MKHVLMVLALIVIGCSKNTSSPTSNTTALEGTWLGKCNPVSSDASSTSSRTKFVVSGNSMTYNLDDFLDSGCTQPLLTSATKIGFSIGGAAANIPGAQNIDMTFNSISMTVSDSGEVTAFNNDSNCGITTWAVGQPQDISGKTCWSDSGSPITYNVGKVGYTIFKVDGKNLYFGDGNSATTGTTTTTRASSLDMNDAYVKQ